MNKKITVGTEVYSITRQCVMKVVEILDQYGVVGLRRKDGDPIEYSYHCTLRVIQKT